MDWFRRFVKRDSNVEFSNKIAFLELEELKRREERTTVLAHEIRNYGVLCGTSNRSLWTPRLSHFRDAIGVSRLPNTSYNLLHGATTAGLGLPSIWIGSRVAERVSTSPCYGVNVS
jgi:hypothetical protein